MSSLKLHHHSDPFDGDLGSGEQTPRFSVAEGFTGLSRVSGTRWQRLASPREVAKAAVERVLEAAERAIRRKGRFDIALAGGSTPRAAYRLLSSSGADWARWQIWFGDERCLPPGDPRRNDSMALEAWLGQVAVPRGQVHSIPAELGPREAAERYAAWVRSALPFDLVLLGLGEDGHTASLFPGQEQPPGELVHAVCGAPKPPAERVSLSVEALSSAGEILVLVTGAGKLDAVRRWRGGEDLPISRVRTQSGVDVLLDEAASG